MLRPWWAAWKIANKIGGNNTIHPHHAKDDGLLLEPGRMSVPNRLRHPDDHDDGEDGGQRVLQLVGGGGWMWRTERQEGTSGRSRLVTRNIANTLQRRVQVWSQLDKQPGKWQIIRGVHFLAGLLKNILFCIDKEWWMIDVCLELSLKIAVEWYLYRTRVSGFEQWYCLRPI